MAKKPDAEEMLRWAQDMFAKMFPKYLRVGPWHPVAKFNLAAVIIGLLVSWRGAFEGRKEVIDEYFESRQITSAVRAFRIAGALWGSGLLALSHRHMGWWPLASYTMQSWVLMTTRYLLGAIEPADFSNSSGWRQAVARVNEALRFPALVQNSVTVTIWWLVLVPITAATYMTDAKKRNGFVRFNASFPLINFHLLNLPLAAADHLLSPRKLHSSDLWTAMTIALGYVCFYLSTLDPKGIHLYIILSPRTKLNLLVTGGVLSYYWGLYHLWNKAGQHVSGKGI